MASEPDTPVSENNEQKDTNPESEKRLAVTQQIHTTGNRWTDLKLAAQRISLWKDLQHIGEIPCARNSLLMGIGAGVGIGFVRGMNAKPFVAANWAMGTFVVVSVGAWNVCRAGIRREREQVRAVVEQMAERKLRRAARDGRDEAKTEADGKDRA